MTRAGGGPDRRRERWLPLAYVALAAALVAVALPSSLRPPPDAAAGTPEIDPNAPPEEPEDSIVSAVGRAQSGTAGAGGAAVLPPDEPPPGGDGPLLGCPLGYGDPPRQHFSLYSAPCAKAWSGDNGGATSTGVSATEIRIGLVLPSGIGPSRIGPVPDEPSQDESPGDRTYRVWQNWINNSYQLYGRRVRLYQLGPAEGARGNAMENADRYKPFGALVLVSEKVSEEMTGRKIVTFATFMSRRLHEQRAPYLWSWLADLGTSVEMSVEYVCRRLAGNPAVRAGDPSLAAKTRSFALLAETRTDIPAAVAAFERRCGVTIEEVGEYTATAENPGADADMMARFKLKGITTLIYLGDLATVSAWTRAADSAEYFPEWFVGGAGLADSNSGGRVASASQWRNAFGISTIEMERSDDLTDCFRAYRETEGEGSPHFGRLHCIAAFYPLMQMANGLQMAGPDLTPQSFAAGLRTMGRRWWPQFPWAVGGGYGEGDWSYVDDLAEITWDPSAIGPDGRAGAYRYLNGARRYRIGEIPSGQPDWSGGIVRAPE